ncbi:Wzz/FepE/Etk N-terminal domain-containing protein [Pilimelia columellifera]|uniref:Polysaccharide chain length determinant N-terminal domain-containing protein n=1 Tax=Pilimelia columellifera subsp. columellifera TaxID=706583 RepID=A0ABP6AVG9_9ACTN
MSATPATTVPDYLGVLRRQWWLLALLTAAGIAGAQAVAMAVEPSYQATTAVLVQPAGQDTNVAGGRTQNAVNLDTEAQIVRSDAVLTAAAQAAGTGVADLARGVTVEVPANTAILRITASGATDRGAQLRARALADAYLTNRSQVAQELRASRTEVLAARIKQLDVVLTSVNRRLAALRATSPQRPQLDSQRQSLISQLNRLSERHNQLTTGNERVGWVIAGPLRPAAPTSPDLALYLASGALLGLVGGLVAATARERASDTLRRVEDLARADIPVLASPGAGRQGAAVGYDRVRNEVMAAVGGRPQVIAVIGAAAGGASTVVAANLAVALSQAGEPALLVSAAGPDADRATCAGFDLPTAPGLVELAGDPVGAAPRATAAGPLLITGGATDVRPGVAEIRAALTELRRRDGHLIVDAGAAVTDAHAQAVAALADAAIIVTPLRHTRRRQLADARLQLARVGVPTLGVVVTPAAAARGAVTVPATRPAVPKPTREPQLVGAAPEGR